MAHQIPPRSAEAGFVCCCEQNYANSPDVSKELRGTKALAENYMSGAKIVA
jgi:hypothetical protein